jgi:hypothetical protein
VVGAFTGTFGSDDPNAVSYNHATGVPAAVTCPACRGSEEWKSEAGKLGIAAVVPEGDFEVPPPEATGVSRATDVRPARES